MLGPAAVSAFCMLVRARQQPLSFRSRRSARTLQGGDYEYLHTAFGGWMSFAWAWTTFWASKHANCMGSNSRPAAACQI